MNLSKLKRYSNEHSIERERQNDLIKNISQVETCESIKMEQCILIQEIIP